MLSYLKIRKAFTMIEVIMVIIVLGIVSSIGAEIIAHAYKSYLIQRSQYRANVKTELALNQIANRLRYAIPGTVMVRSSKSSTPKPITEITTIGQRNVLQWVGADGDSFEAGRKPGWSGFIDLNQSSATKLVTPGSNLARTKTIIQNLSNKAKSLANAKLYFMPPGILPPVTITGGNKETLNVSGLGSGDHITERYKLAWSSYAIVFENGSLWLYYNFPPTPGANLGTIKSKLLSNVTTFSFKGTEGSMWIKICQYEYTDEKANKDLASHSAHSCKEKIILY